MVTDSSEAASTAETFRTYIESPVLSDIQVVYDGFDVYDVEPRSLPHPFCPKAHCGLWKMAGRSRR